MKKEQYLNDLTEIKGMVDKIKNLNESISFEDDFDENEFNQENAEGENAELPVEEPEHIEEPAEEDAVATIREIALKGMIKLCKTPEDEKYQTLKKIFSFCDKVSETKETIPAEEK